MSNTEFIDVTAQAVKNDRSGWEAEDQIAEEYLAACVEAVESDEAFRKFKSNPKYTTILEHVLKEQGANYLSMAADMSEKDLFDNIEKFKENDSVGEPNLQLYTDVGWISPTTARYIKNTFEIAFLVGDIPLKRIVEVGGGYGGLCKVISSVCEFDEYILIDLPEVSALQRKYIDQFPDIKDKVKCIPCTEYEEIKDIDLFISNYALSECSLPVQMDYYDKLVANANFAYIIYNLVNFNDFHYNDFIDKIREEYTFDVGKDYENTVILATRKFPNESNS